jgi:hypothetical protein
MQAALSACQQVVGFVFWLQGRFLELRSLAIGSSPLGASKRPLFIFLTALKEFVKLDRFYANFEVAGRIERLAQVYRTIGLDLAIKQEISCPM